MKDTLTGKQLAKLFGMTERAILHLVQDGMPKQNRGKYNLEQCVRWYINKVKSSKNGRESKVAKQNALIDLQIKEKEMDIMEREGTSLDLRETCSFLEEISVSLRSDMLGSTARISLEVDPDRAEFVDSILQREFRVLLNEIANKISSLNEPVSRTKKELRKRKK